MADARAARILEAEPSYDFENVEEPGEKGCWIFGTKINQQGKSYEGWQLSENDAIHPLLGESGQFLDIEDYNELPFY
jgi:hypothetical protein